MPSNPNIALSVKAPQFRGPLETFSRVQQIAANNMAMQKAQREAAAANAMQTYLKGGGKLETAADIQAAAQAGVDPSVAQKIAEQNLNLGKFGVEQKKIATERLFNRLGAVARAGELGSDAEWVNWLNDYSQLGDEEFREAGAFLNMTKGRYDPSVVKSLMAGAPEYFKKTTPQAQAEIIQNEAGDFFEGRIGGVTPGGAYRLEEYEQEQAPTPTGKVEVGEATFVDGGVGGPVSADDAERFIQSFPKEAQAAIRQRINEGALGNIPMGSPVSTQSLVAGERGGVGGPLEGYVSTGRQLRGRSPVQGQTPGIYGVPTTDVAATAKAQRPTPAEAGATRAAILEAERVARLKAGPAPLTPAEQRIRRDKLADDYAKAQGIIDKTFDPVSGVTAAVAKVKSLSRPQKNAILGYTGKFPTLTASTRAADTAIENLRGIVTDLGRTAAAAAGAVGPMAVQEWKILADQVATLNLVDMEPEDLDRQMNIIETRAKNIARLISDTYQKQYINELKEMPEFKLNVPSTGAPRNTSTTGKKLPPIFTPDQARKAPKGTLFRTTDGRTIRKN